MVEDTALVEDSGQKGMRELADEVRRGVRHAISRAITCVEAGGASSAALLQLLGEEPGGAWRIGVTGPPGAGKSTLVQRLAQNLRSRGAKVGVIAVDPSSPFSQGALLGDRVRMSDIGADDGVFIRSMASRGVLGGLSRAAADAASIMESGGFNTVIVETVGVGQSEIEVAQATDSTVVVLTPDVGDEVQAAKAGVLEIGDVIVVNKGDRSGADATWAALRAMLDARARDLDSCVWRVPLVRTTATEGTGTSELVAALDAHRDFALASGVWSLRRRDRIRRSIRATIAASLVEAFWTPQRCAQLEQALDALGAGTQPSPTALLAGWMSEFTKEHDL